eukprot:600854-Rhodomonas_salina.1
MAPPPRCPHQRGRDITCMVVHLAPYAYMVLHYHTSPSTIRTWYCTAEPPLVPYASAISVPYRRERMLLSYSSRSRQWLGRRRPGYYRVWVGLGRSGE